MKYSRNIMVFLVVMFSVFVKAQIIHAGAKFDRKLMFNATANYAVFYKDKKPFELMIGADFTTGNDKVPSGLAPQISFGYFIVGDEYKDYMIFGGLTGGYLFDFNKEFENQFRITPHIYFEYMALLNLKIGYDYLMPHHKGYPFISIGIGGLQMFRHFKVM